MFIFFIRGQLCNHDSTDSAHSKIEVEIHYINLVEYGHQGGLYSPILARTHAELTAAQKCRACDISSVTFPIFYRYPPGNDHISPTPNTVLSLEKFPNFPG